jgi:hypothetical protein
MNYVKFGNNYGLFYNIANIVVFVNMYYSKIVQINAQT